MRDLANIQTGNDRNRRGVGAIIGGVILAAIMVTTVLVYFLTILNNEKAKTAYELDASVANQEKEAEQMVIGRSTDLTPNDEIQISIDNEGSLPLIISKLLVYCISPGCPTPIPGIESPALTLNGGQSHSRVVGPVLDHTYRIDIISERGNIVSAKECKANTSLGVCENDSGAGGEEEEGDCPTCRFTSGIIQGTGYVQLDFKAFGSIYPTLGDRADVSQQGWLVETKSPFTSATGYPAFEIMFSPSTGSGVATYPIVFVESMRNLDLYNETLTLSRSTSVLTNIGKEQSGQPDIEFVCNATKTFSVTGATTGGSFLGYHETLRPTVLPWVPLNATQSEGWEEVFFCTSSPGTATVNYSPRNTFNSFHPLFVVLRGTNQPSHSDYGQTIPYQSALPGGTEMGEFEACLRTSNSAGPGACPGPNVNCNGACATSELLVYSDTLANSKGKSVWVHVDVPTSPVTVSWIYPNGTQVVLDMENGQPAMDQTLTASGYVPFAVELPQDITCSVVLGEQSYVIKVSDQFDSSGRHNVYYVTWKVTC